ncbi:hypothetical protein H6G33_19390 [Calothrix sp. FACHB-1219]|uniref:hypothetical protein n=1 Tax=unclassified Calothrix TaxID=2619626 RepID=UPI0016898ED6|nr:MULTISPECIES: hypothetical protein [unclassified Calothrix]MBD2207719.1 hypothetical protein [Calothrix sp. FACHB-168]MBD2219188.1 hypothetical protein [Calothrix sp. FACHB-1219]
MATLNLMDDQTLVSQFVQGKTRLASNPNFRIESISTTVQLFSRKGLLLASINLASESKIFLVRQNCQHLELINEVLLKHNFLPTGKLENGLMRYEYYHIPVGYQINYTEMKYLWKFWRSQMNSRERNQQNFRLMIFTGNGFQKVLDMAFNHESFYIRTPNNEVLVQVDDRVIWMSAEQSQSEPATMIQAPGSNLLGLYKEQIQPSEQLLSMAAITTNNIVRFDQGKLYIQTTEGEIVVEGSNLKYFLNERTVENCNR